MAASDIPGWSQSQQIGSHQFPFLGSFYPFLSPWSHRASFHSHGCAALCHAARTLDLPWDPIPGLIPSLTAFSLTFTSLLKSSKPLPPFCLNHFCKLTCSMKKPTIKYLIPQTCICSLFSVRGRDLFLLPGCWWCNSSPCTLTFFIAACGRHRLGTNTKPHIIADSLLALLS